MVVLTQNSLANITLGQLAIYITGLIAFIKIMWELFQFGMKQLNSWRKKKNKQEEKEVTLEDHTKQIADMDARHKEDYVKLDCKIDNLTGTLAHFIDETKKDNQVILRDKIYDIYKITIQKGYVLEKDSKNYHYALDRYKANDGNSYVCDEIEPRMKEFKVFLSDEDAHDYFNKKVGKNYENHE